ncbi:MAG: SAM-dependent methyltransferase [Defluviitaleaceae bacterium]|nr:SAM-dependent methyltransferase [Defluviitaleaceae bacterium]
MLDISGVHKIILSQPLKDSKHTRATIEASGDMFQLSMYTAKQVFHSNFEKSQLQPVLDGLFGVEFSQLHAWDGEYEHMAKVSKKGKILTSKKKNTNQPRKTNFSKGSFNRQKNYILSEGTNIPVLVDMGVFTKDGKVAIAMGDKFGQINRFLELLADETSQLPEGTKVNIVDFGCGKSYLTFLVYHYFTVIRGLDVNIVGLDLDEHVVNTCTAAAVKYGYSSLRFLQGDIGKQIEPPLQGWGDTDSFNIVISLHACDTATDHALFNAIKWNADLIYAVPCCQHEIKKQMKPQGLAIFNRYGIIKERIASLTTDAIRANLLEVSGYKAQIIEFIDMEHTPKNLLIRARRRLGKGNAGGWDEIEKVVEEFSLSPTLLNLLKTAP